MKILSKPEELILLAVFSLKDNAYGVTIRKHIIDKTDVDWTIGAVYVPLNRLSRDGYLKTTIGEPTSERGGKRKKFYSLTHRGMKALAYTKRINDSMWSRLSAADLAALPDKE
ncbi:MAG: PadR family transcriptional regulator [Candidatus Aminicenantes bacterium]|nr:PadR family transcriptional regulator [Candidatus Aminicenantes bacterium]